MVLPSWLIFSFSCFTPMSASWLKNAFCLTWVLLYFYEDCFIFMSIAFIFLNTRLHFYLGLDDPLVNTI
jgi:hypothetical protein